MLTKTLQANNQVSLNGTLAIGYGAVPLTVALGHESNGCPHPRTTESKGPHQRGYVCARTTDTILQQSSATIVKDWVMSKQIAQPCA